MSNPVLKFFDVKVKKPFETSEYEVVVKGHRTFAVAQSPLSSVKAYRILKKGFVSASTQVSA